MSSQSPDPKPLPHANKPARSTNTRARTPFRGHKAAFWGASAFSVAVCALCFAYVVQPTWIIKWPNWFWNGRPWWWPFADQKLDLDMMSMWLTTFGLLALVYSLGTLAQYPNKRRALGVLFVASFLVQGGTLLVAGRGLEPHARRLSRVGQSEFFIRAVTGDGLWTALADFEHVVRDGEPSKFTRNKGPANLGFYVVLHKVCELPIVRAGLDRTVTDPQALYRELFQALKQKHRNQFRSFLPEHAAPVGRAFLGMTVFTWCARAFIPLLVLLLCWPLFGDNRAWFAGIFSTLSTPYRFEHVRLDGSLYPILFLASVGLAAMALTRRARWAALLAGITTALYVYFTLSAVAILPIVIGMAAARPAVSDRHVDSDGSVKNSIKVLGWYFLGACGLVLALYLLLNFHPIDRYMDARQLQKGWRGSDPNWRWVILNTVEFFLSTGPLVISFSLVACAAATVAVLRQRLHMWHAFAIVLFATVVALHLWGANSEVHRLWIFLSLAVIAPVTGAGFASGLLDHTSGKACFLAVAATWLFAMTYHYSMYGMTT